MFEPGGAGVRMATVAYSLMEAPPDRISRKAEAEGKQRTRSSASHWASPRSVSSLLPNGYSAKGVSLTSLATRIASSRSSTG